jgi:hypothetical protein
MFCPLCQAEYREGFTRCADCDVDLVPSLPSSPAETPEEGLVMVWKGTDAAFFGQLVHSLNGTGIACHSRRRQVHSPEEYFVGAAIGGEFELRVFEHDAHAARRILEQELDRQADYAETRGEEQPGAEAELTAEVLPEPDGAPNDEDILEWEAEGAAEEAWTGEDSAHAKFIRDALRENDVGYRTVIEPTGHERILVRADNAPRAREIIREVFEGVPPEEAL